MGFFAQSSIDRGLKETMKRGFTIINRYGLIKNKMFENLNLLVDILEEYDGKATVPIPAKAIQHNSNFLEILDNKRIDIAIHGYRHIDYTQLSYEETICHLKKAKEIFKDNKIEISGFRAPYLKINDNTIKAINDVGIKYDSSYPIFFNVVHYNLNGYEKVSHLIKFYDLKNKPEITKIGKIYEIPVALPDDEILVDRLNLKSRKVAEYWIKILEEIMKSDEGIFVLQLHPERINLLKDALRELIEFAINKNVILTNLKEIVKTNIKDYNHYMVISGDIDIFKLTDIGRI